MADQVDTALKNGLITFLGGLIEPSAEIATPQYPSSPVNAGAPSTSGVNYDGSPVKNDQLNKTNKWLVYGGLGVVVLLVLVLLIMLVGGRK